MNQFELIFLALSLDKRVLNGARREEKVIKLSKDIGGSLRRRLGLKCRNSIRETGQKLGSTWKVFRSKSILLSIQ